MLPIQLLISGVGIGAIYAVVALGFTLVWNASGTVNFAQGQLVMVGAYFAYTFLVIADQPYWLAIPGTIIASAIVGVLIERLTIRPLRVPDPLLVIIITIGTGLVLEALAQNIWGPQTRTIPTLSPQESINLGGLSITTQSIWDIAVCGILMLLVWIILQRTNIGRAMRAVAQDRDTARQMGIPAHSIVSFTFGLNSAMAGLAGLLLAPTLFISPSMGISVTLQAFAAAVLGGFGSVVGAVVGGLILGLTQVFAAAYISGSYADAAALALLIIVLVFRPKGIFRTVW
ncbi:MAG: branched-chain amino acid ABC transporter permease [Cryobacterium sp.]|nr:branched-chain amino acid ABC transporter permease [Cryobacterium sp.]